MAIFVWPIALKLFQFETTKCHHFVRLTLMCSPQKKTTFASVSCAHHIKFVAKTDARMVPTHWQLRLPFRLPTAINYEV